MAKPTSIDELAKRANELVTLRDERDGLLRRVAEINDRIKENVAFMMDTSSVVALSIDMDEETSDKAIRPQNRTARIIQFLRRIGEASVAHIAVATFGESTKKTRANTLTLLSVGKRKGKFIGGDGSGKWKLATAKPSNEAQE